MNTVEENVMNPYIFRKYDIRGIVDKDLTDQFVNNLGRAYGTMVKRCGKKIVAVGGDCRLSTERFRKALINGIMATGIDVIDLGTCTTPILYFALYTQPIDGGIMITGSHNPSDFNGFKLCVGKDTIHGEKIQELRVLIERNDFACGEGSVQTLDIVRLYRRHLVDLFDFPRSVSVAIDAGNGTGGEVCIPILRELQVNAVPLNCTMDGTFPVHHPDPTVASNLEQIIDVVVTQGLDAGIAFDGDTDRIGVVDEKGSIIWGDKLVMLFAREILKKKQGATIISEVKASQLLYDDIEKHGGNGVMWKTGHSLIKAKIKETGAALAGEMSGHMFFADRYFGFDDAIYAVLRLIEIMANTDRPLSELLADVPETVVTPEIRFSCPDDIKFKIVDAVRDSLKDKYTIIDIDGVRVHFEDGWGLLRASNTQAVLVMRVEASTEKRLSEIKCMLENWVQKAKEQLQ